MKTIVTVFSFALLSTFSYSQNNVNCSASDNWIGFMNVFELPANGGAYQWGSGWGVADLQTVIDSAANTLTLQPNFNTYADNPTDPYWVDQSTMEGNKEMEAITFVEPGPTYNGADLNFHGEVVSNTIDLTQYSVKLFIKALDSTNGWQDALMGSKVIDMPASGAFSVSATAAELPAGLVIQYGFVVKGRNGNPAEEAQLGSVVLGPEFSMTTVDFDAADNWIGYMNVFDLPANGGAYQFGSPWAIDDMKATLTDDAISNTLELQPNFNTYADNPTDPFWVDQSTMEGNKLMEASTFVEPGASFNGAGLTFKGDVYSYDIDPAYEVMVFIKALDSTNGYQDALGGAKVMALPTSGTFEVSADGSELPAGLIIQYGFTVKGANANPLNEDALGSAIIGTSSLSVNELNKISVSLYPNPASDILTIQSSSAIETFEVYNATGQMLLNGSEAKVNVESLPNGMYIMRLQTANGLANIKFVKK